MHITVVGNSTNHIPSDAMEICAGRNPRPFHFDCTDSIAACQVVASDGVSQQLIRTAYRTAVYARAFLF